MANVTILKGTCKGMKITNQTFKLIQKGDGWLTVDGTKLTGRNAARILVANEADYVIEGLSKRGRPAGSAKINAVNAGKVVSTQDEEISLDNEETNETDEEILTRINRRFSILNKLTLGAKCGDIRALFVVGAPGVGKTYGVEKTLTDASCANTLADEPNGWSLCSGRVSAPGLYMKLYEHREENNVLVLDDNDEIFTDEVCLNLLKAALDTSAHRMIHWNVDSVTLRKNDVPNSFEFKGSIVFISNLNFKKIRSEAKRNHFAALQSRAFFLDLTIHTVREKLIRIEHLVTSTDMLKKFKLGANTKKEMMQFIRDHASEFNDLSLRTIIKLAGLVKTLEYDTDMTWQDVALDSMMGNTMVVC